MRKQLNISKLISTYEKRTALISGEKKISYRELFETISLTSYKLRFQNYKNGSYIGILSSDPYFQLVLIFAALLNGNRAMPVNPKIPPAVLTAMLNSVNCRTIITDEISYGLDSQNLKVVKLNFHKVESPCKGEFTLNLNQEATLLFSSGSSGRPKGVVHTLGNHIYSAVGSNRNINLVNGDRWLLSLPLFHIGGVAILFRCFLSGSTVVIPEQGEVLSSAIERYRITHLSLVPTQLHRLLEQLSLKRQSFRSLKTVLIGGDKLSHKLFEKSVTAKLPVLISYGSTEMSSQITTTDKQGIYNSGRLLKYRELKITEDGEIIVRGKTLCKGVAVTGSFLQLTDKNGWYHTGDLGCVDSEGYLNVLGRKDNMFISRGENIYPEEIEKILESHETVKQAVVVAVNSDEFGKLPAAFVRLNSDLKPCIKTLNEFAVKKLPKFKLPVAYYKFPKLPIEFKINRKKFEELAETYMNSIDAV